MPKGRRSAPSAALRFATSFRSTPSYDLKFTLARTQLGMMRGLEYPHPFEVALDGRRLHAVTIGGYQTLYTPTETGDAIEARMAVRVRVPAGPHTVAFGFAENLSIYDTVRLQPVLRSSQDTFDSTGRPHILSLEVAGPIQRVSAPATHRVAAAYFTCRPRKQRPTRPAARARSCPRYAGRAYRQPPSEADLEDALEFFRAGRRSGSFETGVERAIQLILASPKFVFRAESDPPDALPGKPYRVRDADLASRLSFFLWSSIPDDRLLDIAIAGRLKDPVVLEQQVRRMLADPKSMGFIQNFFSQWLYTRNMRLHRPENRRRSWTSTRTCARHLITRDRDVCRQAQVHDDHGVMDLLTANYTFVNERLARHYGIPGVYGEAAFRRVTVTDENRCGLLRPGQHPGLDVARRTDLACACAVNGCSTNILGTAACRRRRPDVPAAPGTMPKAGKPSSACANVIGRAPGESPYCADMPQS